MKTDTVIDFHEACYSPYSLLLNVLHLFPVVTSLKEIAVPHDFLQGFERAIAAPECSCSRHVAPLHTAREPYRFGCVRGSLERLPSAPESSRQFLFCRNSRLQDAHVVRGCREKAVRLFAMQLRLWLPVPPGNINQRGADRHDRRL